MHLRTQITVSEKMDHEIREKQMSFGTSDNYHRADPVSILGTPQAREYAEEKQVEAEFRYL